MLNVILNFSQWFANECSTDITNLLYFHRHFIKIIILFLLFLIPSIFFPVAYHFSTSLSPPPPSVCVYVCLPMCKYRGQRSDLFYYSFAYSFEAGFLSKVSNFIFSAEMEACKSYWFYDIIPLLCGYRYTHEGQFLMYILGIERWTSWLQDKSS